MIKQLYITMSADVNYQYDHWASMTLHTRVAPMKVQNLDINNK